MSPNVQYVMDNMGNKTSMIIPFNEWNEFNLKYQKLLNKLRVMTGIKEGIREVKEAKAKGKKLQTLNDFLNESND